MRVRKKLGEKSGIFVTFLTATRLITMMSSKNFHKALSYLKWSLSFSNISSCVLLIQAAQQLLHTASFFTRDMKSQMSLNHSPHFLSKITSVQMLILTKYV